MASMSSYLDFKQQSHEVKISWSPKKSKDISTYTANISKLRDALASAKDIMEPYFRQYDKKKGKGKTVKSYNLFANITSYMDPLFGMGAIVAKRYGNPHTTNAGLKMMELMTLYDLIKDTTDTKSINTIKALKSYSARKKRAQFMLFENGALPGSGIIIAYYYVFTQMPISFRSKYYWMASSYISDVTQNTFKGVGTLGDKYGLLKNYPSHWLFKAPDNKGNKSDYNGDMTDMVVVEEAVRRLRQAGGVDMYMSDGAIHVSKSQYNKQEIVNIKLFIGEAYVALASMNKGSNMVIKIFTIFEDHTIALIVALAERFNKFYISKPRSSKADNSELYLVGIGYKAEGDTATIGVLNKMATIIRSQHPLKEETIVDLKYLSTNTWQSLINIMKLTSNEVIHHINKRITLFKEIEKLGSEDKMIAAARKHQMKYNPFKQHWAKEMNLKSMRYDNKLKLYKDRRN